MLEKDIEYIFEQYYKDLEKSFKGDIPEEILDDYAKKADTENIKVKIIGSRKELSKRMQSSIEKCMERTKNKLYQVKQFLKN